MLRQVDVLGVVEVCIRRIEDGVDHPGLQVQEHSTRDVVLIIGLGEIFFFVKKERKKICQYSTVTSILASSLKSLNMPQSHHLAARKCFACASPRKADRIILQTP